MFFDVYMFLSYIILVKAENICGTLVVSGSSLFVGSGSSKERRESVVKIRRIHIHIHIYMYSVRVLIYIMKYCHDM